MKKDAKVGPKAEVCHYILEYLALIALTSVKKVCCKIGRNQNYQCDDQCDLRDPQRKSFSSLQLFFNDSCLANILWFSL